MKIELKKMTAQHLFDGTGPGHLSHLAKDEEVTVLEVLQDPRWTKVLKEDGQTGAVPTNFLL